jgi:hypothetical protein
VVQLGGGARVNPDIRSTIGRGRENSHLEEIVVFQLSSRDKRMLNL